MIQLEPTHYNRVRPLFDDLAANLVVASILDGHTIGRVYADHAETPQTALIWSQMDTLLLAGNPHNKSVNRALRWLLLSNLMPNAQAYGAPGFTLYLSEEAWHGYLPQIVPGLETRPLPRRAYQFHHLAFNWRDHIPPYIAVHPLDASFLVETERDGMDAVHGWILSFWPNLDAFTEEGLGYAVTHNDAVVSWCLSVYRAQNEIELGVETAVAHHRQGFAALSAAACLESCRSRQLIPHWQCNQSNIPSRRLAEKLGFTPSRDYTATWIPFPNHEENLIYR